MGVPVLALAACVLEQARGHAAEVGRDGRLRERDTWGAHFSIVVVAEGAKPKDGRVSLIDAGGLGRAGA